MPRIHRSALFCLVCCLLLCCFTAIADEAMESLIQSMTRTADPAERSSIVEKIIKNYPEYEKTVIKDQKGAGALKQAIREVDGEVTRVIREVAGEAKRRSGGAAGTDLVLVGSHGTGKGYTPGVSDRDFIPMGPDGKKFAGEFNEEFQKRFGVTADSAKINVLDPTSTSSWPERVKAVAESEKYNTSGGNRWLDRKLWEDDTAIWKISGEGGISQTSMRRSMTEPPPLKPEDAGGFFSDNSRFRKEVGDAADSIETKILKQAKYDYRNGKAFEVIGGTLSPDEKELLRIAETIQGQKDVGKVRELMEEYGKRIGKSGSDAASSFSEAMEKLTGRMGSEIVENHIKLIKSGRTPGMLTQELAGIVANLPPDMKKKVAEQIKNSNDIGSAKIFTEAQTMADSLKDSAAMQRFTKEEFDRLARKNFGSSYDKLTSEQRLKIHGDMEDLISFRSKLFQATGKAVLLVAAGYGLWEAYTQGKKEGGTERAIGAMSGRFLIELMQAGFPPLAVAELYGRLTTMVVGLGSNAFKNATLEELYRNFAKGGDIKNIDEWFNTQSALGFSAGGLREILEELRRNEPGITDSEVEVRIKQYLVQRYKNEKDLAERLKQIEEIEKRLDEKGIRVAGKDGLDNADFKQQRPDEYYTLLGKMIKMHGETLDRFTADGLPRNADIAWRMLEILQKYGRKAYDEAMAEYYAGFLKRYRNADGRIIRAKSNIEPLKGRLGKISLSTGGRLKKANMASKEGEIARAGSIYSGGGAFKGQEAPNFSAGPFKLAGSGRLKMTFEANPPNPGGMSMGNYNAGVNLHFVPDWGGKDGPGETLGEWSGQVENNKYNGEAAWNGAGKLYLTVLPGRSFGPLSGRLIEQDWQISIEALEVKAEIPARSGSLLEDGDVIETDQAQVLLTLPDGSKVLVKPNSVVRLSGNKNEEVEIHIEKGDVRIADDAGGVVVMAGDKSVRPVGTDFSVSVNAEGKLISVSVSEGRVMTKTGEDWLAVDAGNSLNLETLEIVPYSAPQDGFRGQDFRNVVADDEPISNASGCVKFEEGVIPSDWLFENPTGRVTYTSPDPDTLQITVPDGHDFWGRSETAPRLIRKFSGDFDLMADVKLDCKSNQLATLEFVMLAPGSYLGTLARQFEPGGVGEHYRILGGWLRYEGLSKLSTFNRPHRETQDAPDRMVRFKLTRRGTLWRFYHSVDEGKTWLLGGREFLPTAETVYAGFMIKRVAADGSRDEPAVATLHNVEYCNESGDQLKKVQWDVISASGNVLTNSEKEVSLQLVDEKPGNMTVQSQLCLQPDSDFACVVSFEPESTAVCDGKTQLLHFAVTDNNGQNYGFFSPRMIGGSAWRYAFNYRTDNRWASHQEHLNRTFDKAWLCVTRRSGIMQGSYWEHGAWVPLKQWSPVISKPLFLELHMNNLEGAQTHLGAVATFTLVQMLTGAAAATAGVYLPDDGRVFTTADLPASFTVPVDMQARALRSPFDLARIFFDNDGNSYVLSCQIGAQRLVKIDKKLNSSVVSTADILHGINCRSGAVMADGKIVIGLDYWPSNESGNQHRGLFIISPDGSYSPREVSTSLPGLADVCVVDDGLVLSDFEARNLFYLKHNASEATPLVTSGETLLSPMSITVDKERKVVYCVQYHDGGFFRGKPAVYEVSLAGGAIRELVAAPEGGNFHGITTGQSNSVAEGLLVGCGWDDSICRIDGGKLEKLFTGITKVGSIGVNPVTGELFVLSGSRDLLVIGKK